MFMIKRKHKFYMDSIWQKKINSTLLRTGMVIKLHELSEICS